MCTLHIGPHISLWRHKTTKKRHTGTNTPNIFWALNPLQGSINTTRTYTLTLESKGYSYPYSMKKISEVEEKPFTSSFQPPPAVERGRDGKRKG